ncbi:MAG: large conductance mechanosensitive channel protein MscL [Clostridia bacterium]|nr:large conductance mechanosensitive channel protein MscL [Clostridia bacterium]MBQ4624739.1 large conductance mechanosensitive channel protein MscL [Clostridia bacterium]
MSKKVSIKEKGVTFWNDFKAFAFKGNVLDMAVGVIVATAFTKIVNSLVNDVFMPFISWLFKLPDFATMNIVLVEPTLDAATGEVLDPGVTMLLGSFILNVVNFFLIALFVFVFIRTIAKLNRKKEAEVVEEPAPAEPPKPTAEDLLAEIRDLLKKDN